MAFSHTPCSIPSFTFWSRPPDTSASSWPVLTSSFLARSSQPFCWSPQNFSQLFSLRPLSRSQSLSLRSLCNSQPLFLRHVRRSQSSSRRPHVSRKQVTPMLCKAGASRNREYTQGEGEQPPGSREEAIQQARTALSLILRKALGKSSKKNVTVKQQARIRVEVPVLDDSAPATTQLVEDIFRGSLSGVVALYFGTPQSAELASDELLRIQGVSKYYAYSIDDEIRVPDDAAVVVFVSPTEEQIPAVQLVTGTAGSRPIVILNPEWDDELTRGAVIRGFVNSFDVCYSFLPIQVQGFLSSTEGALLKFVKGGSASGTPWLFFIKSDGRYGKVQTYRKRPTAKDIEDVFYNWFAANSPINKSIGFVRNLVTRKKPKSQSRA